MSLSFDVAVPRDGYRWWYLDATSDDGRMGLTVIAFVGSVFSPYYAHARRHGRGDPLDHCALNVALYGAGPGRWALTERGRHDVDRSRDGIALGPSSLIRNEDGLDILIDEIGAPLPRRLRGRIRVHAGALNPRAYALDANGRHLWQPLAPTAEVEVCLETPALRWRGAGYLDTNHGSEPVEDAFSGWDWSRARDMAGHTVVFYDTRRRDGTAATLALRCAPSGVIDAVPAPRRVDLPGTLWRVARATRAEPGPAVRVIHTLEDTPFYARSLLATHLAGSPAVAVHESLSLDRFRARWVQCLLPFRMPRHARR